jgi:hypothetical protein
VDSSHCATAVFRLNQWVPKRRKRLVGRSNRFKRMALRREKMVRNVSSIGALALVFIIVESVQWS